MTPKLPQIPGFSIERLLGEGAAGRVYLAHETEGLRRPIALKVFFPDHRGASDRELEMARRIEELRRRERRLELVQSLGTGEHEGSAWLALEYLEDGSLAEQVAKQGPLGVDAALEATRAAGVALQLLHAEGLFHRDVKPANLLRGADGKVRLGDFGLSRELDGTLSSAGSPAFAAPEVIAGKATDGRSIDIYSLGATLAFLLTGEVMLPGKPDAFLLERRGVPRSVQEAILSAMAYSPEERPGDVSAFLATLPTDSDSPRTTSGAREGILEGSTSPMKSTKDLPQPVVPIANLPLHVDAARCPFCHELVEPKDPSKQACTDCMAWHHSECWGEHGGCAACQQRAEKKSRGPGLAIGIAVFLVGGALLALFITGLMLALLVGGESAPSQTIDVFPPSVSPPEIVEVEVSPRKVSTPGRRSYEAPTQADLAAGVFYQRGKELMRQGREVEANAAYAEAKVAFEAEIALGNGRSMSALGWMYQTGKGVPQSDAEAVALYRKGAEAGYHRAMTNLADMLAVGRAGKVDPEAAERWYLAAIQAGSPSARSKLGALRSPRPCTVCDEPRGPDGPCPHCGEDGSNQGLSVVVETPVSGTRVRRFTFKLRVRVKSAEAPTTVELVVVRPRGRNPDKVTVTPLEPMPDGRWGLDAVPVVRSKETAHIKVRDATGVEGQVELSIVDETGWRDGWPMLHAPGTPTPSAIAATTLSGKTLLLALGAPTLVVFYGTWDDCEHELAWAMRMRAKYESKGLTIIGIGSVPPKDADAFKRYLAERQVTWENVIDVDGALAAKYWMSPRRAVGNAAFPVVYFVKDGKVHGGDYVEAVNITKFELLTNEALAKAFR